MAQDKKENEQMNRVIINGDDYGLNERNSRAIADAIDRGLITDTTMLANIEYFGEAVRMAEERGFTDRIGIHFNLTFGEPLTEDVKACPAFVTDGRFNKQYNRLTPLSKAEKAAIYKELTAQVEKIERAGIKINHADSHHHIHTAVFIAPIVAKVCREHGITKIRLQRNLGNISAVKRFVKKRYNRWLMKQGFTTTRYFAYVIDIADGEIPDNTEIMVHPDYDKDGVLIDRRDMDGDHPIGYELPDYRGDNVKLRGYTEL